MAAQTRTALSSVIPFIYYEDPAAAIEWLKEAFGFSEHAVHRAEDGTIAHAELRLGTGIIMPGAPAELGMTSAKRLGGANQGNYVVVEDPDAHFERARAAGAEIVEQPTDRDYGSREYTARDPDGNVWTFGTYDPSGNPA
jgi:uncharacterized glyoxalase superfamily protein PhnB